MSAKLKIGNETPKARTAEEAARAAPVELPAGSYDAAKLSKSIDRVSEKDPAKRAEKIAETVTKANQTEYQPASLGLNAGEKRVDVDDETLGITESRVVYDPPEAPAKGKDENAEPTGSASSEGK